MKKRSVASEARRRRDAYGRDPLKDNEILIRAVEIALQMVWIRKHSTIWSSSSRFSDEEYLRKFVSLALNPAISSQQAADMLGVHPNTYRAHLDMYASYLKEFIDDAHELRKGEHGYRRSFDMEEEDD